MGVFGLTGTSGAGRNRQLFLILAIVGYGLDIALVSLAGWPGSSSAFSPGPTPNEVSSPFTIAKNLAFCLSFFVWFALAMGGGRRFYRLMCSGVACWVFSAMIMAGSLVGIALLGASSDASAGPWVEALYGLLMGVGLSGNFALWVDLFAARETPVDARGVIGGTLLGGLIYFMLAWLPERAVGAVAALLVAPGTSSLLYVCKFRLDRRCEVSVGTLENLEEAGSAGADMVACYGGMSAFPLEPSARWSNLRKGIFSLLMPCVTIGAIGAAMQIVRVLSVGSGLSETMFGNINSLAFVASAVLIFIMFERTGYHVEMNVFYRVCAPLIGLALIGLPLFGTYYGYVLVFALYTIFSVASMMGISACMQVARHYSIPAVALYSLLFGIIYTMRYLPAFVIGMLGAADGSAWSGVDQPQRLWCTVLCVALMFCAYVASDRFLRKQDMVEVYSWESRAASEGMPAVVTLDESVARFGEDHGLTSRETEVLLLLYRGRTTPVIADHLGVSQNTVRFHCKNLYAKLGVHSKQELLELVEGQMG